MYQIREHTADIGLDITSDSLAGVFAEAAKGFYAILLGEDSNLLTPTNAPPIDQTLAGDNPAHLLVDWLSWLLYRYEVFGQVMGWYQFSFHRDSLTVHSRPLPPAAAPSDEGMAIKAVTYHKLQVESSEDQWHATVFFDI